jgi:uncharacterized membrane protein
MKLRKSEVFSLLIILASFITGWYFYPQLPDRVASHWNAAGEVNGYMSKFWGTFLMPIISIGIFLLLIIMPKIDPRAQNIEKFRKYFDGFIVLILLFLFYIYGLTLAWNLGSRFDMGRMLVPALAILFFYTGIMIKHAQMNWTIGIRTPWTLSNQGVWEKTHKIGGILFQASAIISLLGLFFPQLAIWLVIIPIILSAIFLFAYSYFLYRKIGR